MTNAEITRQLAKRVMRWRMPEGCTNWYAEGATASDAPAALAEWNPLEVEADCWQMVDSLTYSQRLSIAGILEKWVGDERSAIGCFLVVPAQERRRVLCFAALEDVEVAA